MIVTKQKNGYVISSFNDGHLLTRLYIGYTKSKAISLFKQLIKLNKE